MKGPHKFFDREVSLTNTQNALFSSLVVVFGLTLVHFSKQTTLAGFFVVAMQSVSGVNFRVGFGKRVLLILEVLLILLTSTTLATISRSFLLTTVAGAIIFSFGLALCRQLYPKNWHSINIPAGVLYFMALTDKRAIEPIAATALGGIIGIAIEAIVGLLIIKFGMPNVTATAARDSNRFRLTMQSIIYAAELSFVLIIGLLIYTYLDYPHGYWLPFTALVVIQISHSHTLQKVGERILGTLIGCIIGSLVLYLHPGPILEIILLAVSIFLFLYYIPKNYSAAVAFVTIYVLILIASHAESPFDIVIERIAFTLAGGVLGILSSFLFLSRKQLV